jgi:hypothetical protein
MSNLDFDLDDLTTNRGDDSEGIKSLRNALKALKQQITERDTELSTFRGNARKESLTSLLKSKGVPEVAFGLYPKDAEASEEAVTEWVNTYGAAFGVNPSPTGLSPEQVAQMQTLQQASAQAPSPTPTDAATLMARIQGANSKAELDAVYAEFGLRAA